MQFGDADHHLGLLARERRIGCGVVMKGHSRREFLLATGAAAASPPRLSTQRMAHAALSRRPPRAIPPSEWDYRTAKEIAGALPGAKNFGGRTHRPPIARIEARDKRDQCRRGARLRPGARRRQGGRRGAGEGRAPAAARRADDRQGVLQRRRPADHLGLPAAKDFRPTDDALAVARLKAAGAVILGKTNVPLSLGDWQSYNDDLRHHQQPLGPDAHAGRLVGRLGGGAGRGLRVARARLRYRRLAARAGALLRRLRPQADARPGAPRGHTPPNVPPLPVEHDLVVIGPMARSAADLALDLDIVPARTSRPMPLPTGWPCRRRGMKIFRASGCSSSTRIP